MKHEVWFGHPYSEIRLPICRVCKTEITAEIWLKNQACPGAREGTATR